MFELACRGRRALYCPPMALENAPVLAPGMANIAQPAPAQLSMPIRASAASSGVSGRSTAVNHHAGPHSHRNSGRCRQKKASCLRASGHGRYLIPPYSHAETQYARDGPAAGTDPRVRCPMCAIRQLWSHFRHWMVSPWYWVVRTNPPPLSRKPSPD